MAYIKNALQKSDKNFWSALQFYPIKFVFSPKTNQERKHLKLISFQLLIIKYQSIIVHRNVRHLAS